MKSILFTTLLCVMVGYCASGQNRKLTDAELNNSAASKITFADTTTCNDVNNWIKTDIHNNTILLFLFGGIAPISYPNDTTFENRLNVHYYDLGEVGNPDNKCVVKYNYMVFDYLNSNYGKKWMAEIRKDAIGFSTWKKTQKKSRR